MQITANINDFLVLYPQFNTDALRPIATFCLDDTIIWAKCNWDLPRFGARINSIIYLLTAHRTLLSGTAQTGQAGQGGQVASANVDGVSISYVQMPAKDAFSYWLSLSPYGIELCAMLEMISGLPSYIGGSFERVFS